MANCPAAKRRPSPAGWARRVIAIDRLGHGESDKPHGPALYVEDVIGSNIVAVLTAERVDRALVWGFSMRAVDAASGLQHGRRLPGTGPAVHTH
jgi:pimeloyl-ACP methyl ester carboxylesterase